MTKKYINREISWLSFNARVLQEAMDTRVPLLERLKFLGIYSSNLDEFYSVRVGNLNRLIASNKTSSQFFGDPPTEILKSVDEKVQQLRQKFDTTLQDIQQQLKGYGVHFISEKQLSSAQQNFVKEYFDNKVRPRLIPIMLDNIKKFPYLKNCVIYLMVVMYNSDNPEKEKHALIEVPADVLPRFVLLPSENSEKYVIMLDDIIRYNLKDIFNIFNYDQFFAYTIKLTRDAEYDIDDDIRTSMYEKIAKSIKTRESGDIVRLIYDKEVSEKFLDFIFQQIELRGYESVSGGNRYHNARDMMKFAKCGNFDKDLFYEPIKPLDHPHFQTHDSIFKCIREQDILLHYPYHSFHSFIDLLREAAIDPKVKSIKMTIYRLADQSDVVNALLNALLNGKNVTVVMELQARFDEESNIKWSRKLEESGANLISSIPGMKVHSKLCLITRRVKGKKERYAVISTGNFNESTAKLYTDHVFFTYQKEITKEVKKVFEMLNNSFRNFHFRHLLTSPAFMRKRLAALINNEIRNARNGNPAAINIKVNNLMDKAMTDRLYRASRAGVKIRLLVRSVCSVIPGLKNTSENIEIHSIVDKFLEHSRIYWFHNNSAEKIYIGSADMMVRNLDRRVEVLTPIYDKKLQQELKDYFEIQFADTQKARYVNHTPENQYITAKETRKPVRAQEDLYQYLKTKNYEEE